MKSHKIKPVDPVANHRIADEYDAAQQRGEVASSRHGKLGRSDSERLKATAADIGLSRKEIHEARVVRVLEKPGRPAFTPTAAHRRDVGLFRAGGLSEVEIAAALGIARGTLRKAFKSELGIGRAVQRARNLKRLAKAADKGSVTAQKALHQIFDHADRADLLQDPDFGAKRTAEAKVRGRLSKKELVLQDARDAGLNNDWGDDLPPPGTRTN